MITCVLRNHNFVNEVQVMTQVFFPGEKFFFIYNEDYAPKPVSRTGRMACPLEAYENYVVESEIKNGLAFADVYKNGKKLAHSQREITSCADFLNERRVLMLSLYHALQDAVGAYTPWGALTGIRPSKLVREWKRTESDSEILARLENPFCVSEEKAKLALTVANAESRVEKQICGTVGLYISVPFCPSRCIYCSFNTSHKLASDDFLDSYVTALLAELHEKSKKINEETLSSIYIGGGTPTFLPENLLEKLLYAIRAEFPKKLEFTVEAGRPDTLTASKLKILRKYGVSRIAVNPQTLNNHTLKNICRNHTAEDFFKAFSLSREMEFSCINTDLIAGLPGETSCDMQRNMEALAKLQPENVTIHTLALKRASLLNEQRQNNYSQALSEWNFTHNKNISTVEKMLSVASEYCKDMKVFPYYLYRQKNMTGLFENIGYSKPGFECLYNVGMMAEVKTIFGVGAGAVSKFVDGGKITREFNVKNPEIFIKKIQK